MYREPAVWHALLGRARPTRSRATSRAQVDGGSGRDPAVRLLGRHPLAGRLRGVRRAVLDARARGGATRRRSTSAPGRRTSRAMRDAGGDVIGLDWRVALDEGWAAVGSDRGVQGNLDPAVLLGPWERDRGGGAGRPRPRRRPAGHVFNLGHGVLPETDPDCSDAARRRSSRASIVSEWPRRPDGVRHARSDRGRARVLRGHPGRPADPAGAARPLTERYRRLGIEDVNPLNVITEETRAALEAELGLPVFTGMKHWTPRIADAAERRSATGADDGRRARARAALLARVDRRLPAPARGGARRPGRARRSSRAGTTSRASSSSSPTASGARTRTSSSRLTRSRPAMLDRGRPVRGPAARDRRASSQSAALRGLVVLASSRSRRPASRGSSRTSSTTSRRSHARGVTLVLVCPVGFVSDHLEIRWDLDVEAQQKARRARHARSTGSRCRTPTRRSSPSLARPRRGGRSRYRLARDDEARRDPDRRRRPPLPRRTRSPCAR